MEVSEGPRAKAEDSLQGSSPTGDEPTAPESSGQLADSSTAQWEPNKTDQIITGGPSATVVALNWLLFHHHKFSVKVGDRMT